MRTIIIEKSIFNFFNNILRFGNVQLLFEFIAYTFRFHTFKIFKIKGYSGVTGFLRLL